MKKALFVILVMVGSLRTAYCQDSSYVISQSIPVSWFYLDTTNISWGNTTFRSSFPAYSTPAHNNAQLQARADSMSKNCTSCAFLHYFGYGNINSIDIKASAQFYDSHIAGGKLWIMHLTSQTALGFQFYFSKLIIPKKSYLYIYTADRSQMLGGYSSGNTPDDTTQAIHFGTTPIYGNDVYIEYYESDSANFRGSIVIDNIIHIFNPTLSRQGSSNSSKYSGSGAADCQNDAACSPNWDKEVNSVALIVAYNSQNNFSGTCSGAMINNTLQNGEPYFLTAAHCAGLSYFQNTHYLMSTWQFIFDYQTPSCNTGNVNYSKVVYGAVLETKDSYCPANQTDIAHSSDYMLLHLNTNVDWAQANNICYSGWEFQDPITDDCSSTEDPTLINGTFIHHPQGDVKKISSTAAISKAPDGYSLDPSMCVNAWTCEDFYSYSSVIGGGGPEPGSSGGPLYDDNHRIIGTVTGAITDNSTDPCQDNTYVPYFGRFARHWANSGGIFSALLDPKGNTDQTNSNYDPNFSGIDSYCPYSYSSGTTNQSPNYYQNSLNSGIIVATSSSDFQSGIPVICSTTQAYIFPANGQHFSLPQQKIQSPSGDCNSFSIDCSSSGPWWNRACYCNANPYEVYVQQLDDNLQPVGQVYSRWEANFSNCCPAYIPIPCFSCLVDHNRNSFPGFIPGSFYSIGLGSGVGGWQYSSTVFYVLPNTLTVGGTTSYGTTVSQNLFSKGNITLQNTTVTQASDIIAATYIDVKKATHLEKGHYAIKPLTCGSFRLANPNGGNQNNQSGKGSTAAYSGTTQAAETKAAVKTEKASDIVLYPNPATDALIIEFKNKFATGKEMNISVYNSVGELVSNQNIIPGLKKISINTANLTSGIYNIRIFQNNQVWADKFAKQ